MKYNLIVFLECVNGVVFLLPRFTIFNILKSVYLRVFWRSKIGKGVIYYSGVRIFTGANLTIGNNVDLAKDVIVTTSGGVTIGDRTLVGYRTQLLSSNHKIPLLPDKIFESGHDHKHIVIGSDVWIGANCLILAGVEIGKDTVIAAGSVVTKNVPEGKIYGGVPAREIGERNSG